MESSQKRTFWTRKKLILVGVVGAAIVVVMILVWWVWLRPHPATEQGPANDKSQIEASVKQAEQDGKLREEAAAKIKGNSTADANDLYQQAVDAAASAERKTRLYIDLSGVYYAAGKYQEAFDVMDKANDVNPDKFLIADWLSRLYEDQKNYAKAAEYYALASKWADSKQNITGLDKAYYDSKAAAMAALAGSQK
jgi:tetratricopeptide (TPR) repeat protein